MDVETWAENTTDHGILTYIPTPISIHVASNDVSTEVKDDLTIQVVEDKESPKGDVVTNLELESKETGEELLEEKPELSHVDEVSSSLKSKGEDFLSYYLDKLILFALLSNIAGTVWKPLIQNMHPLGDWMHIAIDPG